MTCNCQFHQQGSFIHVLVKGKDIQEEDLDVRIQQRRLTVVLNKQTLVEGLLQSKVDVGNCRVRYHPDHVEIKLRKADASENWPQLLLGVPDMMTSLQRASNASFVPMVISPEHSPMRGKSVVGSGRVDNLNASLSNFVHKVFTHGDEQDDMRDETIVF